MSTRRWVLSPLITAGFALALFLLLAAGVGVRQAQIHGAEMVAETERTLLLLEQTEVVLARVVDAESGQRGYLLTGADRYLKPYEEAVAALPADVAKLGELCAHNPDEQRRVARLDVLTTAKLDELRRGIDLQRLQRPEAASSLAALDSGKATMDRFRAVIADLESAERADLQLRRAARDARRGRSRAATTGSLTFAAVLVGATLLALNRQTRRRLVAEREWERALRTEVMLVERATQSKAAEAEREELLHAANQARAEAERAMERARRLVDANVIGVMFGRGDLITEANDAALATVGYARADLEAGPISWRAMTPPEFVPLDDGVLAQVARGGVITPYEKAYVRKDGTRVPVLLGVAALGGPGTEEWVCFLLDLTERHRALAAVRAAKAQAEAANRSKDEFLAVLSHEMRSPLHATLGWLAILKKGLAQGRDVSRAVAAVERNAGLQSQLVNDLLDVSRIVSDKLAIAAEPVDLCAVVDVAVENARPAAEAKGVALACEVALRGAVVIGDEQRLAQVLGNLLGNAVKFTPSGGRVSVTLRDAVTPGEVTLQVCDTGSGIAPELLVHVFDRFRQADATSTRVHGGLGIGLYLVKTLVELHGGGIAVSSEGAGKGATFTVRLPLQGAAPAEPAAGASLAEEPDALAGLTVVLVEDDSDSREALRLALEYSGAEVHACGSAAEARRVLAGRRVDVIVSDIGMPGEDGHAFLRAVRAGAATYIPAVAITGFASRQDREEAVRSGFDDHLAKPVHGEVLIARLRGLVRRTRPGWSESGVVPRTVRLRVEGEG